MLLGTDEDEGLEQAFPLAAIRRLHSQRGFADADECVPGRGLQLVDCNVWVDAPHPNTL